MVLSHLDRQVFLFQEAPWTAPGRCSGSRQGSCCPEAVTCAPQVPPTDSETSLQGPQASGEEESFVCSYRMEIKYL